MGLEIERKFLVVSEAWREAMIDQTEILQGYLVDGALTVRARLKGERAFLTLKGETQGLSRAEFEYEIPPQDAREMLSTLAVLPIIEKIRHRVRHAGHIWEVDVFAGENRGLVMAELELVSEDEPFERPDWIGQEVSHDPRYRNRNLAEHPFNQWAE